MAEPAPNTRLLFFRVFPSIALPMFLAALDNTIIATALPNIAATLGDVERISWVVVSYLMASTVAAAVYGRLGDAMGRKRLLLIAMALFIAASALCALAPTLLGLVFARLLQGAGGGGLMTLSQALVGEAVPPRERVRYQGYLAGIYMVASAFGPVAGGWLTQHWGWTSVFWINLPLGALATLLATRLQARPGSGKLRFDWIGLALFTTFVVALLLALEQVQHINLLLLPYVAILLAIAATAMILLLRQERRASAPLIPVNILRHPAIWRADTMAACVGATIVATVSFMPIYLQVVRGVPPGEVGLLLLPLTVGIAFGSLLTGRLVAKTGRTAIIPSIGQIITATCLVLLALTASIISLHLLPALLLVLSMSIGTAMPIVQVTVQTAAGPKNLGAASASVQFSRSIGAALGTALVGAVLFATLAWHDPAAAQAFAELVERGPTALATFSPDLRESLPAEIGTAFRAAFLTIAAFAAITTIMAWTLPMRRLND